MTVQPTTPECDLLAAVPTPDGVIATPWRTDDEGHLVRDLSDGRIQQGNGEIVATPPAPAELEPVDLDGPDPAIARWEELSDWDGIIYHDGDAEKMLPFPRPAWADPDQDDFGQSYQSTCYSSRPVRVPVRQAPGNRIDEDRWAPAAALVSAELYGTGINKVAVTLTNIHDGKHWRSVCLAFSPEEALELADVLRAAVDLLGGVQ